MIKGNARPFYCSLKLVDCEDDTQEITHDTWRQGVSQEGAIRDVGLFGRRNYTRVSKAVHTACKNYFNSDAWKTSWQADIVTFGCKGV